MSQRGAGIYRFEAALQNYGVLGGGAFRVSQPIKPSCGAAPSVDCGREDAAGIIQLAA
jgi:hypothetical protein